MGDLENEEVCLLPGGGENINNEYVNSIYTLPNTSFENGNYYITSVDNNLYKAIEPNNEAIEQSEDNDTANTTANTIQSVIDINIEPKEQSNPLEVIAKDVLRIKENIEKMKGDKSVEQTLNLFKQNYVFLCM